MPSSISKAKLKDYNVRKIATVAVAKKVITKWLRILPPHLRVREIRRLCRNSRKTHLYIKHENIFIFIKTINVYYGKSKHKLIKEN